MARKSARPAWLFVTVLALAVIAPGIVYAATGTFSSSSSTAALTAKNTGSGKAVNAVSNTGYAGTFSRGATSGATAALYGNSKSNSTGATAIFGYANGTGENYGVLGRTTSATDGATGVFGNATAIEGLTNGVFGQAASDDGTGVLGFAPGLAGFGVLGIGGVFGVIGSAGEPGDGTYGLFSTGDVGIAGHLVAESYEFAGACTVLNALTTQTCTFADPFAAGIFPVVVITPTVDPGPGAYWVSSANSTGFTITLADPAPRTVPFNFIVVGVTDLSGAQFSGSSRLP